jgi:hypothetical protein
MEYIDNKMKDGIRPSKFILYRIDNLLLLKYYIGITYSVWHPLDRKYQSSSGNDEFWEDLEDHSEWFRFTVINYFDDIESLRKLEHTLTSKEERKSNNMYNLIQAPLKMPDVNKIIQEMHDSLPIHMSPIFRRCQTRSIKLKEAKLKGENYYSLIASITRKENNRLLKNEGLPYQGMNFNSWITKESRVSAMKTRDDNYLRDKSLGLPTQYDKLWTTRKLNSYKSEWDTNVLLYNGEFILFEGSVYELSLHMYGSISHISRIQDKLVSGKAFRADSNWKGYKIILKEHATTISKESTPK